MPATQVVRIPFAADSPARPFTIAGLPTADEARAATAWLRRVRCGLSGHEMMLRFEPGRLSLQCPSCGRQTPGWSIGHRPIG